MVIAGVYDALKQKYLKCLLFGISEDERGSCLMEVSSADAQSSRIHSCDILAAWISSNALYAVLLHGFLHACTVSSSWSRPWWASVMLQDMIIKSVGNLHRHAQASSAPVQSRQRLPLNVKRPSVMYSAGTSVLVTA